MSSTSPTGDGASPGTRTSPVKVSVARNSTGRPVSSTQPPMTQVQGHSAGQALAQTQSQASKAAQVQTKVDEVIDIMQNNIDKVMQRGEKLETLQNKTDDLSHGALQFKKGSAAIKNEMWWKNMKLNLIIAGVVSCIIVIAVVGIVGIRK
nr:hypothetical protein HK105_002450 [Polyrhizophydium stewartii]